MDTSPYLTLRRRRPSVERRQDPPHRRFAGILGAARKPGTDPIGDAILASAERARRLGDTVPLRRENPYWFAQKGRVLISALAGGLSLWTMALFLLALE
jgi:hypothetical protein